MKGRIKQKFNTGDCVIVLGNDGKPKFNGRHGVIIGNYESADEEYYEVYVPGYKEFIKVMGKQAWTSNFTCPTDSVIPYDEWVKDSPNTFEFEMSSYDKIISSMDASSITNLHVEPEECVDWQDYEMTLAHDIAVAYAEKGRYEPREIGSYAVLAARSVVQNLKKKQS